MSWQGLLDWEEGVFRTLLAVWRKIRPLSLESVKIEGQADFDSEAPSLVVVAQALTEEPVRVQRARGAGGVRGGDLLLPRTLNLFPSQRENREAYLVQTVIAAGMRRLTKGRQAPREGTFENAIESLGVACHAVELMRSELPMFGVAYDAVVARVLASRDQVEIDRLPPAEAELERLRRSVLSSSDGAFEEVSDYRHLTGPRVGKRLSPDVPIWGRWLPSPEEVSIGSPTGELRETGDPMTEQQAPDIEALTQSDLTSEDSQDPAPSAPFERAESLDSYRGGARDLDGTDELEAHLDALEQVELGELFRGSEGAESLLKADLDLGRDVSDATGPDSENVGIAYDEWDQRAGRYRKGWCTVYPMRAGEGDAAWAAEKLHGHRDLVETLRRRLEAQRAGLRACARQLEGEEIDLEAAVDDWTAQRAGCPGDPRVYRRQERRRREFATTVLVDVSMSTDSWIDGRRTLDVAREAALVLGEVADQLQDRIQVLGFASETRNRCHVWQALGFGDDWNQGQKHIAWLKPQGYTRIGPALRHATALLSQEPAEKRLLILISDGKPTDYDRYEGRYGIADVRRALQEAERSEIHTHALAVDSIARDYLPALFGEKGWHILARPEELVESLTEVYGRLTSR